MYKLLLSLLLVLGLIGCSSRENLSEEQEWDIKKQTVEEKAPDFVLEDLEGKEVKLSNYQEKVVLLVFSTTWCPYCRAEIPELKKIYSEHKDKDFELINIDIQESQEKVSSFAAKYEIPYRVLLDKDGQVAYTYGIRGVPTKILVDKNGVILCRECRSVEALLEKLL